ncbi:MAG: hypothetical protein LBD80_08860 [Tannerella sp.]|jgi:hypothetical protein|nr:hypothetical protein [Tannerella sp.]
MQKKGIYVLLIMLVCCFSAFINMAELIAQNSVRLGVDEIPAETLSLSGPWTFGKTVAWAFVAFIIFVMLLIFFKVIATFIRTGKLGVIETKSTSETTTTLQTLKLSSSKDVSEEVYAAIAMALYEWDEDVHDVESTILTFYNYERTYSPWNLKIYGLREIPARR